MPTLLALACLLAQASAPQASTPAVVYDDGLRFTSADGSFELVLEGLFQATAAAFGGDRDPSADFGLRRMRPELSARLPGGFLFKLEPKFTESEVELEEAWVGADLFGGEARLMAGRMKVPFGLEEVRSRRWIDFTLFSILNQFSPAEDHGLFLFGATGAERAWEWNLALYNGTGGDDTNGAKDVAARLMWHPFAEREGDALQRLQVGVAATVGDQDDTVAGDRIKNAAGLGTIEYAAGARLSGARQRVGLEAAWFSGPNFVQAEVLALEQELSSGGNASDVGVSGAYLTLAHVLTGEDKSFKGVHPEVPYDFKTGLGRGAWVAALRLSQLDFDDDLAAHAVPGTFTDRIRSAELGLDWIPNRHAILRAALVRSEYDDAIDVNGRATSGENALLFELQLHF